MQNVTLDKLEKKFPGEGMTRFKEIAKIGGFGEVSQDHTGGIDPNFAGGLDIKGAMESSALTKPQKDKILELAGETTTDDVVINESKKKEK